MKHLSDKTLAAHALRLGEPAAAQHLAHCEDCRARLAAWEQTLAAAEALDTPLLEDPWPRLAPLLEATPNPPHRPSLRMWVWAPAAAVLACALALWWARPFSPTASSATAVAVPEAVSPARPSPVLRAAVAEHFDRTQALLIELAHARQRQAPTVNLSREKALARQLATNNQLYLQSATWGGDHELAQLLGALQPPLLEIAHSPDHVSAPHWQRIQHSVAATGLLFKLRVVTPDLQSHGAL